MRIVDLREASRRYHERRTASARITDPAIHPEVSVIVPARNEEACLADCLRSLVGQTRPAYELIVVDDHSTDATRAIAEGFAVRVIAADALPSGWSGKCNAAWTGARSAKGKWLLFTDADTKHAPDSIACGLREAIASGAALLSYSPRQEVQGFWERALMPVIFAELAATYRPSDVCDPGLPAAAANGQYLLIRQDAYEAIGGHAAVAASILEDVELATRAKQAGYRLQFRWSDVVSTRMYRSFPQMWEGWTKNLALLFPQPRALALSRAVEFLAIAGCVAVAIWKAASGEPMAAAIGAGLAIVVWAAFLQRIRRAHFGWLSNALAIFGLPLFAILLLNSDSSHKRGEITWKGRKYGNDTIPVPVQHTDSCQGTTSVVPNTVVNSWRLWPLKESSGAQARFADRLRNG
jgi:cellulose synthase/poly-beta-1,6-N-acetylglucosamine synthase-like glycosyltransferase